MIACAASDNLLASATVVDSAAAFLRGFPGANAWDTDLGRPAIMRGRVKVPTTYYVDFNDGAVRAAILSPQTFNSVTEALVYLAARMNAVSSGWRASWLQGSDNRYRLRLWRASGTGSLLNASGVNAVANALVLLFGFGAYDRADAAAHVGDFAVTQAPKDQLAADLGAAGKVAEFDFVVRPGLSQGGGVSVTVGSTSPVDSAADARTLHATGAWDTEIAFLRWSTLYPHRYAGLNLADPRREDSTLASVGYWYHGPGLDTDRPDGAVVYSLASRSTVQVPHRTRDEWERGSWRSKPEVRAVVTRGVAGHVHVSEVEPGRRCSVSWGDAPGYGPEGSPALRRFLTALGTGRLGLFALDPDREPHRESFAGYLTSDPRIEHTADESPLGTYRVTLELERAGGLLLGR